MTEPSPQSALQRAAPSAPAAPARSGLDRAAVERVLARAAQLQANAPEQTGLLTEAQILELGQEVGLAPEALRQALAEERTRSIVPEESGMPARLFGPRLASASRTVPGTPERVLGLLEAWMSRDECLQTKRRFADRVTWEARRDLVGSIRRGLNLGGRGYALTRAREVGATVVPVDGNRVLVHLDADIGPARDARLRLGGATAATGVATGGALAAVASMVVVPGAMEAAAVAVAGMIPALTGLGGAYAIARGHAALAARVQLALEQLLDRLEHERV